MSGPDESNVDTAGQGPAGESIMAARETAPEGAEHGAPASGETPDPIGSIVAVIMADAPRLADPELHYRAGALSELDAARLVARLRKDAAVTAADARSFSSKVGAFRKDRERREAAATAAAVAATRGPSWRDALDKSEETGKPLATFANLCLILGNVYGDRLAYDCMAERPLLDGAPLTDRMVSTVRRDIGAGERVNFTDEDIGKAMAVVGGEIAEVHPVRDYLTECRARWDGKRRLDGAADVLLGVKDRLSGIMVRRTLIAAAARGMFPGCKVDTILILLGGQGIHKSTFFRKLGGPWFGDSKVDITDRKGQMVMASRWIYEWPEVDRVFARHSDSDIKAFVSQQDDTFIPMFGRATITLARSWLAVGTTNKPKFLTDTTGDRRVWLVDLRPLGKRKIDGRKLDDMRDHLFGEAVAEVEAFYDAQAQGVADEDNPHRWFLNDAEEDERAARTKDYHVENPWADIVGRWLAGEPIKCPLCKGSGEGFGTDHDGSARPCLRCNGTGGVRRGELPRTEHGREYVTCSLILSDALDIPAERQAAQGTKIADVLASLGWVAGERIRVPGSKPGAKHRVAPYYSPEPNPDAAEREACAVVTSPMGEREPNADAPDA